MEKIVEKIKNYSYSVKAVNVFNKLKKGTEYLEDSINVRVPKLVVKGKCVQDGEPTPDAPVEIKTVKGVSNYLPYPYVDTTKTTNGITFTDNGDGSITINGTSTANASFKLYGVSNKQVPLENKYVTCGVASNSLSIRVVTSTNNTYNIVTGTNINNLFAKVDNTTYKEGYYELVVYSGHTIDNIVVKPMIIDDINKIDYVPYGTWLEVKSIGKNLANYNSSTYELSEKYNFNIGDIKSGKTYSLYLNIDGYTSFNLKYKENEERIKTEYHLTGKVVINFTTDKDGILWFNGFKSDKGTLNNITEIMLVEGIYTKDTIGEYEPYKESTALIDMSKKNLFDKDTIESGKSVSSATGAFYNDTNSFSTDYIYVKGLSNIIWNGYSNSSTGSWGAFYDSNKTYLSGFSFNGNTIKIPTNAVYVRLGILNTYLDTLVIYQGIDLNDTYEFCSIGDIEDIKELSKSMNKTTQRIGKVVLNGSESWVRSGGTTDTIFVGAISTINLGIKDGVKNSLCTHFTYSNPTVKNTYQVYNSGANLCLRFDINEIPDANALKTWLSENPVTVYYILATPTEIEQEVIELPYTYEDATHISSNDELAEVEVDYYSKEIPNMNDLKVEIKEV